MIVVTFTPSKGTPFNGILLKRDSGLCLIAFDQTAERPFSVGWCKLDDKYQFHSRGGVRWLHPAMRMIAAGDVVGAMEIYWKEDRARKEERLRKEKSI